MIYGGEYGALTDLAQCVEKTVACMKSRIHEFDSIVVRGVSGIVVGSPVALALDKPLVVVRKPDEQNHDGSRMVVNRHHLGKWVVFLDDFRATGETEKEIRREVESWGGQIGECFFYHKVLDGGPSGWVQPSVLPRKPRYNEPGLQIRHRGVLYPATITRVARVRVLVSYEIPVQNWLSTGTERHTVWLRPDDERLYYP